MKLFDRFKKLIACVILTAFIPSQAWAQGISIPANSAININNGSLVVPGAININPGGTLSTQAGPISLTGNWSNAGTFSAGIGTVYFNGTAGTQTITSGGAGVNQAFYNLTHNTASTVQLNANDIAVNNNFVNTAGAFNAAAQNIDLIGNWENSATFTPGTSTLNLNGNNQWVMGSTTFYSLNKTVASGGPYTLTFDAAGTQTFSNTLTMQGNATHNLDIRSSSSGSQANIYLSPTGHQTINNVDVKDSNAGVSPAQQTLVGRGTNSVNSGNNANWQFGNTTITWTGGTSTDWNTFSNWSPLLVPGPGDVVIIPSGPANQPVFSTNVNVETLTIQSGATVNINGYNLTVTSTFTNFGTLALHGNEATVSLPQDITNGGTFEYLGDGTANPITIIPFSGTSNYANLLINDTNATKNIFVTNANIKTVGNVTVTSGTLDISANTDTLTVGGNLVINGANGTVTATNGNIITTGAMTLSAGTLTAPGAGKTFDVGGNWTNNAGNYVNPTHLTGFNNSSGVVTLDGNATQSVLGSTVFYGFVKTVSAPETLTFDATGGALQTFNNSLTLAGSNASNLLTINSTIGGTQANIALTAGALQSINYVNVQDSNAGGGLLLIGNNASSASATQNNTNWVFGGTAFTWTGTKSTDWNVANNWNLGTVPIAADTVIIPNGGGVLHQPVLTSNISLAGLTINNGSTLTLAGYNLTVALGAGNFNNNGTLILQGNEVVTLTMDSTHGTFDYVGVGGSSSASHTLSICTSSCSSVIAFNNLTIDDPNATPADRDMFQSNGAITVNGNLTVTSGTFDTSNSNSSLAVTGNLLINANGNFNAPTTGKTFTLGGNWTNNAGNYLSPSHPTGFNNESGTVTLNGAATQTVLGTNVFYNFVKNVTAPQTLTFDATGGVLQTFKNSVTMTGSSSSNLLTINSTSSGTQAFIALTAGGAQMISFANVQDSNASGGLLLLDRNPSISSSAQRNINWSFGTATFTWTGGASTAWNNASNWDLGEVPGPGDTVIIANAANQPVLSAATTIGALTINSGSTLTLSGNNLSVNTTSSGTGILTNNGTIKLNGSETVNVTTANTNAGTFEYDGDNTGSTYNIASLLTVTNPANGVFYNLTINDTHATADTFTIGNAPINVYGNLTVTAGTLNLTGSTAVNVAGNVSIASAGTLQAPSAATATAFTVGGNWTNAGHFVNSNGEVTFTTTATATITGNTTFYNFLSTAGGKTFDFAAGSTQTVTNSFNLQGLTTNNITLRSTVTGQSWNLTLNGGTQTVNAVNVENSVASATVDCLNCTDAPPGGTNTNWVFQNLDIVSPGGASSGVGQTPTIIGQAPTGAKVYIRDSSGNLVATAKGDTNGYFRVVIGQDAANTGLTITQQLAVSKTNSLTPYLTTALTNPGTTTSVKVVTTPTTDLVPLIQSINAVNVNPGTTQFVIGNKPTIAGLGLANQPVTVQAFDANGNLLINAGSSTVSNSGAFSVTFTTPLPGATNYISVTVGSTGNETTSALIQIAVTDPYGYVYNSANNQAIQGATVTLYNATTKQVATGVQSCDAFGTCTAVNPFTTGTDGFYSFLAPSGEYYVSVSAFGYSYPSVVTTVPSGRTVTTGSKGETFTIGSQVVEIDLPMDGNASLLHITKVANKSEVSVGDIVMYTVNIQNLSATQDVGAVYLNDQIPPGFKYVKNRVLINNAPTFEPAGQRPLIFNIGNVMRSSTDVLQYQLVVGSGVTMGTYRNTATARFQNGQVISNPAEASVKIIPDPVFDLGNVIGKVFFDWNENGIQDPPYYDPISHETIVEKPVPNVQIVMEDGTVITTDRNGQFNIPGLLPGRHLFRLDERTLPPGAYLTTDKAVIVDVTAGSISKVNFGVNIDETQTKGKDAVFFNEKIGLIQDRNKPIPRLNAALFNASANAAPNTEEVVLNEGALVRQAEFRIFTNYWTFISKWHLDIMDADTHKVIRTFQGTPESINDPIYWNGQDDQGIIINPDHKYSYVLTVNDDKYNHDDTKEKLITVRQIRDDVLLKKEREETKDILKDRADRYRKWLDAEAAVNNLDHQLIQVQGETIHLNRQGTDVRSIHVMKGNQVFTDIPLKQQYGLTPDELMAGGFSKTDEKDNLELILPNGDYSLDVVSAKAPGEPSAVENPGEVPESVPTEAGMPARGIIAATPGALEHYSRPLKVGDDYVMFVALGDAQTGYNIDRGNIEPIQDSSEKPGFYTQGKAAYYLKGQILGKYLITSSFDTDRQQKALFRQLDPNTYYPVYGDGSSINYDASDTQGPLYLKVEWDKSQAILGNYAVDFNDTEFAAFSQKYYGGIINYQSVSSNPYGDARTKIVVYHAQVEQQPSHNEFLATGGSLYFLKFKNVIQGSDTVTIQVRDQTTGLVVASQTMVNGADYELDNANGSILFWQPVAMIAQSENIISNNLVNGNPIYVVVDYQYQVSYMPTQGSEGARVAQAIGNNVVLGGTYVTDDSSGQNYTLEGTDATLHVNKDTTVKAEYAQTKSQEQGSYVSTDGGITFTSLGLNSSASGEAYGIKGDTRLFDNVGLKTYYKWIGNDFGATGTTYQQGKESMGMTMTFDMTPVTRLTASEDIQKLLAGGNLQTSTQVGASETDTTMIQIVHTAQKLTLTGQFQLVQTKSVINGVESTTNQRGATLAGQAQYDLTNRIKLTLGQQVDVENANNTATTLGISDRITEHTTLNAQDVFSSQGSAITGGITNQLTPKIAITNAFTLTSLNTGEVDKTLSVAMSDQVSKNVSINGTTAVTSSSTGTTTTTASVGTKAQIAQGMNLAMSVGKTQTGLIGGAQAQQSTNINLTGTTQMGNTTVTATGQASGGGSFSAGQPLGGLDVGTTSPSAVLPTGTSNPIIPQATIAPVTSAVGLQATTKVNEALSTNASLNVANPASTQQNATFGFGNTSKLNQELQAVTNNSLSFSPSAGGTNSSQYGLVRTNEGGQKVEADFTKQTAMAPTSITDSNIFGLSGDVNDKLALNAGIQRGKVQNLNTSQSTITDFSVGSGYVLKDTATAEAKLQNSVKLEMRVDRGSGTDSTRQYVLYDALQGKLNDNTTANVKIDYSKTLDTTTGATAERHQEIILGMAYRPINFDKLNLITEYSYQEGYGGGLQQADALNTNVSQTVTQVFSGEAVYDINDKWQAAEKIAYRILNEQDTGFAFTQTHTWLVIHRLNYKIDSDWTISGELRDLAQVEAKDNKAGILLQATRELNQNTELSIGWNFTKFSDDLTNLSYTTMGPFVRMTGKFYDESPEERARAKAKWLDARINEWAWILIRKELGKKESKIVLELNRMFALAKAAEKAGRLEESRQIYKDIISAGQMMYDEASEYIRGRIDIEEQLVNLDKAARAYFRGGEYVKARKIWEKVVEDASKGVVK